MTKSARARFSSSGIWRARIAVELGGGHAGPREHPRALDFGRRGDDDDLVELAFAAGFEQQGNVEQQRRRIAMLGDETLARLAAPPDGRSLRARRARRGSSSTICGERFAVERSVRDRARETLADRARPARRPGPAAGALSASASNTGTPARSNILATVDLPMPIEPVSAILIMRRSTRVREARRAAAAAAFRGS